MKHCHLCANPFQGQGYKSGGLCSVLAMIVNFTFDLTLCDMLLMVVRFYPYFRNILYISKGESLGDWECKWLFAFTELKSDPEVIDNKVTFKLYSMVSLHVKFFGDRNQ